MHMASTCATTRLLTPASSRLWRNSQTDRKTKASIRSVPLLGIPLEATHELHRRAVRVKSD